MKKTIWATQFKLTFGIGSCRRVCEQIVWALIYIVEYSHWCMVLMSFVAIGRTSSVVKNVFRSLRSLRWYFGYAMYNTFRWIFRNEKLYKMYSMRMLHMQCHAHSFAWTESDWTLRNGVISLISSISCTKQLNIFMHFLRTKNCLYRSFWTIQCSLIKVLANGRRLFSVFIHALVLSESVTYITCITQVSLKFFDYTLLINKKLLNVRHF